MKKKKKKKKKITELFSQSHLNCTFCSESNRGVFDDDFYIFSLLSTQIGYQLWNPILHSSFMERFFVIFCVINKALLGSMLVPHIKIAPVRRSLSEPKLVLCKHNHICVDMTRDSLKKEKKNIKYI